MRGVEQRVIARLLALTLLVAATAYALHRVVYVPLRCARSASNGAAALQANGTPRLAARVRDDLRGCKCVTAREAHIDFVLGGVLRTMGDDRAAIDAYQRSLAVERRPEIYFGLGLAQLNALQRGAGIDSLTRACAFDPARLADVPYQDVREEVERRLRAAYGADWLR